MDTSVLHGDLEESEGSVDPSDHAEGSVDQSADESDPDYVPDHGVAVVQRRSSGRVRTTHVNLSAELYGTLPTKHPDFEASAYHPNIFFTDEEVEQYKQIYSTYTKTASSYFRRKRGRKAVSDDTTVSLALNYGMTETAWRLFVGLDESEVRLYLGREDIRHIYHDDVEKLLHVLKLRSTDPEFMKRRTRFRSEYIGDAKFKCLDLNGVIWMVSQFRELPWMIPIENFHFHNALAISWRKATLFEMILCGRLVHANERLYTKTPLYKRLFPLMIEMNKHLVHKRDAQDFWEQDVWDNWQDGAKFFWYRPCFRVCVFPSLTVQYCMMLAFRKEITRQSRPETIVVPAYSHVYSFAGEVRPVDLSVDDSYGFDLIHNRGEKYMARAGKSTRPELVCTNYVLYDNRPGVGSAAYMANHTCGVGDSTEIENIKELRPNEYFYMSDTRIGNKEGNAIANADMLTAFVSLKSCRDITSQVVTEWMDVNRTSLSAVIGNSILDQYDLFPVEFVYNRDQPKDEGIKCKCLTRCSSLRDSLRSNIHIANVCSLTTRPSRTDIRVLREEIDRFIPDEPRHTYKRNYIREYLNKHGFGKSAMAVV
jgi:hypothetical protein